MTCSFNEFIQFSINNRKFLTPIYIYVKYMFEKAWTKLEISVIVFVERFLIGSVELLKIKLMISYNEKRILQSKNSLCNVFYLFLFDKK